MTQLYFIMHFAHSFTDLIINIKFLYFFVLCRNLCHYVVNYIISQYRNHKNKSVEVVIMQNNYNLNLIDKASYMIVKSGVINTVSNSFLEMVDYSREKLINKSVYYVFKCLKIGPAIDFQNLVTEDEHYIFTKAHEVLLVSIEIQHHLNKDIYIFTKKPEFNLSDKLPLVNTICSDNHYGLAVFTFPDLTLLKANEKFKKLFDDPYSKLENYLGRCACELSKSFSDNVLEGLSKTLIDSHHNKNNYVYEIYNKQNCRFRLTISPFYENYELKYITVLSSELAPDFQYYKSCIQDQTKQLILQDSLINLSQDAIFAWEISGKIIYWSQGAEKMYGYSSDEALGDKSLHFLKAISDNIEDLHSTLREEKAIKKEEEMIKKDGKKIMVSMKRRLFLDTKGRSIVLEIHRDISHSKRMDKIKQQKEELEEIIQSIDDGIIILDSNKNSYLVNNEAAKYMRNYESRNFQGWRSAYKYTDFEGNGISPDDMPITKVYSGQTTSKYKLAITKNNKTRYLSVNAKPIYSCDKKIKFAVFCFHDVTHAIKYENSISEQKKLLEDIINNLHETIMVCDKNGKYIVRNKKGIPLYRDDKYTLNKYNDRIKLYRLDGREFPPEETATNRIKCGKATHNNIIRIDTNSKSVYYLINGTPVFNKNGELIYGIISSLDITMLIDSNKLLQKTKEDLLKLEKEKNQMLETSVKLKDEFLSVISHEFRTPINVIYTAIQAIESIYGKNLTPKVKEYINMIKLNVFRQLRLANNLIDISNANSGNMMMNMKNVDIVSTTKAIAEAVNSFAKLESLTFSSSHKEKLVALDTEKYQRVLLNLISNAIKFSKEKKNIAVRLTCYEDTVCIEVEDNGIGIPEDKIGLIFEKFRQIDSSLSRNAEGTGIGLFLVKKLVEALGGDISVKSKLREGSIFSIILPCKISKEAESQISQSILIDKNLVEAVNIEFSDIYF